MGNCNKFGFESLIVVNLACGSFSPIGPILPKTKTKKWLRLKKKKMTVFEKRSFTEEKQYLKVTMIVYIGAQYN